MAARRLIAVLLVLFAISIAAASVAPDRRSPLSSDEEASTTAPTEQPEPGAEGGSVTASLQASAEQPETVRAAVGDQVELSVTSRRPLEVEIPDLGLLEPASADAPALFNILLRESGDLPITDAEGDTVVGRLLVGDGADGSVGPIEGPIGAPDGKRTEEVGSE